MDYSAIELDIRNVVQKYKLVRVLEFVVSDKKLKGLKHETL